MPTSQWLDKDVGLGFTSIYNRGYVGVATDDPRHTLQIGGTTDPLNLDMVLVSLQKEISMQQVL